MGVRQYITNESDLYDSEAFEAPKLRFSQNLMNIEAIILIYAWGGLNVKFFPGSRVDSNMLV